MPTEHRRSEAILLVASGGFVGANLRYGVDLAVPDALAATLAVNVVGSFALALVLYASLEHGYESERVRFALATGLLSSFTTYSTFVLDAVRSDPLVGAAYVLASYVGGFGAVLVGHRLVHGLLGREP